jgi:hypothetical protein
MTPGGHWLPLAHAPGSSTFVGVWSSAYSTSNITITNGLLGPGSQFTVDINVTNAPQFKGFELALFYDPTNITAASYDVKTSTLFPNPYVPKPGDVLSTPGSVHLSVVNLGSAFIFGSGPLAHINFRVTGTGVSPLVLAAGTAVPSSRAGSADGLQPDWTRLVFRSTAIDVSTSDGYFKNIAGPNRFGPVASFAFSPSAPQGGQVITFNATASSDPDKPVTQAGTGIKSYFWDFGEGSVSRLGPVVTHTFAPSVGSPFVGNFSVLLKVFDNDTLYVGMITQLVSVTPAQSHDVALQSMLLNGNPATKISPGDIVHIAVTVVNQGTFDEKFNLTISYTPPTKSLQNFTNTLVSSRFGHNTLILNATLDTKSLDFGTYTVTAVLSENPLDSNPLNNLLRGVFSIVEQPNPQLLAVGGGAAVFVGVLAALAVFLRRRRREVDLE